MAAQTCFLVWIIVVDLQPVKHIPALAPDGNTHVVRKPEGLKGEKRAPETTVEPLGGGPSLTPPPVPHAATTSWHASSRSPR